MSEKSREEGHQGQFVEVPSPRPEASFSCFPATFVSSPG